MNKSTTGVHKKACMLKCCTSLYVFNPEDILITTWRKVGEKKDLLENSFNPKCYLL